MNVSLTNGVSHKIKRNLFKLKPERWDGLVLNIHHSNAKNSVRFLNGCFHNIENILASADNDGNVYIVNITLCKFWGLKKLDSCTCIKFSSWNSSEIIIGEVNGNINIVDFYLGQITNILKGHELPVKNLSLSQNNLLSFSQYEAIIWDLSLNLKIQVLCLEKENSLKYATFMPVSEHILTLFHDDLIEIWDRSTFKSIKHFLPVNWNNYAVKSITFSRNGKIMIVSGYLPILAVFLTDKWNILKFITLSDFVQTIKQVEFIPNFFDGGCNKTLAVLSGQGKLLFYDMEQNRIISKLYLNSEIIRFESCPKGNHVACVLSMGHIEIFNLNHYTFQPHESSITKVKKCKNKMHINLKQVEVQEKIANILEINRLKAILKEYGEYPEVYRIKIWENLLKLPNNIEQYNGAIDHVTVVAFENIFDHYPLESVQIIKSFKKVLNNIVTWCNFFANVDYLPMFVFPFVKVFHNNPVVCFEALCTIIWNWCQHWFEYYPLPPVNILAIIENVLLEHEPDLIHHFYLHNITPHMYIWPLVETVFSEVLNSIEWLQFWDHVLTNEPSFLLFAVVSYNSIHKNVLLCLTDLNAFQIFYHNRCQVEVKKFLKKTYHIMNTTSKKMHPRQYLNDFQAIQLKSYPVYLKYPKASKYKF